MNFPKSFLCFLLLITFNFYVKNSFSTSATPELFLANYSGTRDVSFKIYPISCVFNADSSYNLKAKYFYVNSFLYINGRNNFTNTFVLSPNTTNVGFGHEAHPPNATALGTLGYGKYKIEVTWDLNGFDTCTIEYDKGYAYNLGLSADCTILFRDDNSDPRISFFWSNSNERNCRDVNKKIEAWNQYENGSREKIMGNFVYDAIENLYTIFPQDSRRDCDSQNQIFTDNRSGELTLNLINDIRCIN